MRNILGSDTSTGIANSHFYLFVIARKNDFNAALSGVFSSVIYEVHYHLAQPFGVGGDEICGRYGLTHRAGRL